MIHLQVYIEVMGTNRIAGHISGQTLSTACFRYDESYLDDKNNVAISLSLPLEEKEFSPAQTKNFFEGLLPEGFTRRCVAQWLHADEDDYISILAGLGKECLGAIKIVDQNEDEEQPDYKYLNKEQVTSLAMEGATKSADIVTKSHLSLTGASGKVGLYYDAANDVWYQPIGSAPSTHIVKQSHVRLDKIVTNEQLCLLTAKNMGIEVPDSFIINSLQDGSDTLLFATKRYDRKITKDSKILNGLLVPSRLHQEDFAQALGVASINKYEKTGDEYLKRVFELVLKFSANPIEDQLKLWDICIFNYLIGNTDNHIKNLSLLYSEDMRKVRLAPAYDIVSTVIYEGSTENMALSIGGEYNISVINRESFEAEADKVGLGRGIALKHFDKMRNKFENALTTSAVQLAETGFVDANNLAEKILNRMK